MTCKHTRMNRQSVQGCLYFLLLYYTTLLDRELKKLTSPTLPLASNRIAERAWSNLRVFPERFRT